jgi:hypothetical protein
MELHFGTPFGTYIGTPLGDPLGATPLREPPLLKPPWGTFLGAPLGEPPLGAPLEPLLLDSTSSLLGGTPLGDPLAVSFSVNRRRSSALSRLFSSIFPFIVLLWRIMGTSTGHGTVLVGKNFGPRGARLL